ncbi:MAG: hypothetical protein AB7I27_12250 [Bacteriovoracaceae bacterium]
MKTILFLFVLFSSSLVNASVVGVTTHPLNEGARVFSAEMTGYMNLRHEMGGGLRYTQEMKRNQLLDVTVAGAQESRAFTAGTGMDIAFLEEDVNQPRVSIKPYFQYQKFNDTSDNFFGAAPTIRKGFVVNDHEFFPYLAIPSGMKVNNDSSAFNFYSSLTLGASMPFPGQDRNLLLSFEGNKNMGSSSDYIGCLVSWIWK